MLFIPIPFAIFKWSYEQVAWNIDDDIKALEECPSMNESLSEEIRIINNLLQKWTYILFIQRKSICNSRNSRRKNYGHRGVLSWFTDCIYLKI